MRGTERRLLLPQGPVVPGTILARRYSKAPLGDYAALILADSGIQNYFKMDEASGNVADSKGSGVGTAVGSPTYSVAGIPAGGTGITCVAGSAYFTLASLFAFSGADVSIEFWGKLGADPNSASDAPFMDLGIQGVAFESMYVSKRAFTQYLNAAEYSLNMDDVTVTAPYSGGWHHYVFTLSTVGVKKLYYDGVEIGDNPSVSGGYTGGTTGDIGQGMNITHQHVAFYNRILSAADVLAHYNRGAGIS